MSTDPIRDALAELVWLHDDPKERGNRNHMEAAWDKARAALAQQTVSGAPDSVGIPAGEQTGPVLGAPTSQRADEPVAWRWSESNGERWFDWTTDWDMHRRALATKGCLIQYAYSAAAPAAPTAKESLPVAPAAPAYVPLSADDVWNSREIMAVNGAHAGLLMSVLMNLVGVIESVVVARMRGEGK